MKKKKRKAYVNQPPCGRRNQNRRFQMASRLFSAASLLVSLVTGWLEMWESLIVRKLIIFGFY
jgi:hypothetical protein